MMELKIGNYFVKIEAAVARDLDECYYNDVETMQFLCSLSADLWTAERQYRSDNCYALARHVDKMGSDIFDALKEEGYFND